MSYCTYGDIEKCRRNDMDMKNKKVLVFGSGISGIGAGKLLEQVGASVVLYDGKETLDKEVLKAQLGDDTKAEIILGELSEEVMETLDLVVMSPGVPTDLPVVLKMRDMGIPIWGEVELAYTYGKGDVLAITGTNGKTTTTALLGEIMKNYKESVFVVGNIGNPYTAAALEMREDSVAVAEMSSFQLETIHEFRPKVSAILNITPDHLNRHHTMEAYIKAKEDIAKNQTKEDTCVLNYEDEVTRKIGENVKANVLYFSSQRKLDRGIYLDDGNIILRQDEEILVCNVNELKLLGTHNYENVMAAVAMAAAYGTPMEVIRRTIKEFAGVEHRIEFVREKDGVAYYNDSKGTNPDAAIKGIQAMNRPTVLIGGGYDKDSEYEEWIQAFDGKVKLLVLVGATKEKIAEAAERVGFVSYVMADSFEEAVEKCIEAAEPGDAVLLSPACASWGMFKNYEERGDKFKELVNCL
jgi:UDP-N-acetylmuramoylalanine--D-glutamate ligase